MKEIFDRRYPVTSFFLLVTTLVFVLMFLTSGFNYTSAATLYKFGAVYPPAIKAMPEQIWRLFSATFVHIGLEHFLVNMLSLYFWDVRWSKSLAPSSFSLSTSYQV